MHSRSRLIHLPPSRAAVVALLFVVVTNLSGCTSPGPLAVDPEREFGGIRDVVNSVPDGGNVDIFLVHGMRADGPPPSYDVEVAKIQERLSMTADGEDEEMDLVLKAPTVTMDGVTVFDAHNWSSVRPHLRIQHFRTPVGDKKINFYRFEYWQPLAYLKCLYVVAPDTRVEGTSSRATYCNQHYKTTGGSRLSSSPEFGNRWIKVEIMEWGLADAVIATSSFRSVLRQAVREAMAHALEQAQKGEGVTGPHGSDLADLPGPQTEFQRTRFAFISESLGSYVVHDALLQSVSTTPAARAEREALEPDESVRNRQTVAPQIVVCGASQVHMFANQLALLRLSELNVAAAAASDTATPTINPLEPGQSHFFRGCPRPSGTGISKPIGAYGAQQVVAYHDPNDLLTYYTSDQPGEVGAMNMNTINVVSPFAKVWVPFVVADPIGAHTDQANQNAIMDMVVCGRKPGSSPACPR
jgi:hypothetical protein